MFPGTPGHCIGSLDAHPEEYDAPEIGEADTGERDRADRNDTEQYIVSAGLHVDLAALDLTHYGFAN
jgi:hypothetical protein